MKIKLTALLAVAILSACSATGDDYVRGQTPTVINHPVLGSLTVAERELLGPDVNQNGIRDDIDVAIRELPDEKKPGIVNYVKEITRGMIFGSRGISSAAIEKSSTSLVSPPVTDAEKICYIELVTNTVPRKAAFDTWKDIQK